LLNKKEAKPKTTPLLFFLFRTSSVVQNLDMG